MQKLTEYSKLIVISVFLLGPFLLVCYRPDLEPYPAVLLPAGARTIELKDSTVSFAKVEMVSIDETGQEHPISPRDFFQPIPVHYWPFIASREFGLGWLTVSRSKRKEAVEWLRARLATVGRQRDGLIRVRWQTVTIDNASGVERDRVTTREFELSLKN